MNYPLTILGFDTSTDITGVALVRFDAKGTPDVLHYAAFDAKALLKTNGIALSKDSLTARFQRMWAIKRAIHYWCYDAFSVDAPAPDVVAFERNFNRGDAPTQSGAQSVGMYLGAQRFAGCRIVSVNTNEVKACWHDNSRKRRANRTRQEVGADNQTSKLRGIEWARQCLRLDLLDTDDAISDACGVVVAAHRLLVAQAAKSTPQPQPRPRTRGKAGASR